MLASSSPIQFSFNLTASRLLPPDFRPDDLQAVILQDHGLDHTRSHFFSFLPDRLPALRRWISRVLAPQLSSQEEAGNILLTASISGHAYRLLGIQSMAATDRSFLLGMHFHSIQERLADPVPGDYWEKPYLQPLDLLVQLAANDLALLLRREEQLLASFGPEDGLQWQFAETGKRLYRTFPRTGKLRVEHFGYADGLTDHARPADLLHREQQGRYGSYLVFRKLEQDIAGFRHAMEELATHMEGPDPLALAKAQLIGRFEDGTPLVLSGQPAGVPHAGFDFDQDTEGRRCPFHAHIRKTNPRHQPPGQGSVFIGRRSIPYDLTGRPDDLSDAPSRGAGLLFQCYQASITSQFEHIQANWASNKAFPNTGVKSDRMVGQRFGRVSANRWNRSWDDPDQHTFSFDLGNIVWLKGGGYFFTLLPFRPSGFWTAGIRGARAISCRWEYSSSHKRSDYSGRSIIKLLHRK